MASTHALSLLKRGMRLSQNCGAYRQIQPPIGILSRKLVSSSTCQASEAVKSTSKSTNVSTSRDSPRHIFLSGSYVLPHPDKMASGGEDWYYIANNLRTLGVADGVGGWADIGVDAGAYARELMRNAQEEAERLTKDVADRHSVPISPQQILEAAHRRTHARGSSTVCVAALNVGASGKGALTVSNLGDSGLLIVRGGEVVFHTPQQQHGFNFPYQVGSQDSMSDSPAAAQRYEFDVKPGDCVVLGTDGLWDNCFNDEIAQVVRSCLEHKLTIPKTAQILANYARYRASDAKYASPFAHMAFNAGVAYMGGKMDDITVVVALVQEDHEDTVASEGGGVSASSAAGGEDNGTSNKTSKL